MKKHIAIYLILPLIAISSALVAQQSSKSKSKDRFREKATRAEAVKIRNLTTINTKATDYSPAYYQNGVVFVSSSKKNGAIDPNTGETYADLYFTPFDPEGLPTVKNIFALDLRNSKMHVGPVTFSSDYRTMYYTQNNQKGGVQKADDKGVSRLKVYEARKSQYDWLPVGELPFNSASYSCTHPSLSPNGKRLYFASDMPGGKGGFDIYYVDKQADGTWGTPVNVEAANSAKTDMFPFIHANGDLYFSSTGRPDGKGGLDIYKLPNGENEVVNQEIFNSNEDDLGFIINEELDKGFFTSNRKPNEKGLAGTMGKDDIWFFSIENGLADALPATRQANIKVMDGRSGNPIFGAEVRILKATGDGFVDADSSLYELDVQPSLEFPGQYTMEMRPKTTGKMRAPDYHTDAEGVATNDFLRYRSYMLMVSHPDYQLTQQLVAIEDGEDLLNIPIKLNKLGECYRATGMAMTDILRTRIGGADVKFVHKSSNRIISVRTGLSGEFTACLPEEGEYLVTLTKKGFEAASYAFNARRERTDNQEVLMRPTKIVGMPASSEVAIANAVESGSVVVLDKIRYDNNQVSLNASITSAMHALIDLMGRSPNMTIELVAHTDTRGDAASNLKLSQERANYAIEYLAQQGNIEPTRLKAVGKGSTQPRNRCAAGVNCSDDEHRANLRFEAIVRYR
jgi:outer membrane protein OmpA-like peptidoglycan-associated protein